MPIRCAFPKRIFSTMRYAKRKRVAAIDTGWFDRLPDHGDLVQRPIAGDPLTTEMLMLRSPREQRAAAEHFWNVAAGMSPAPSDIRA